MTAAMRGHEAARGVATIDCWDTLLRRRCHPDQVKLMTLQYLVHRYGHLIAPQWRNIWRLFEERLRLEASIGARHQSRGLDDEYGVAEVVDELIGKVFVEAELHDVAAIREEIVAEEVRLEIESSYADPDVTSTLRHCAGRPIVVLSDFYLSGTQLMAILRKRIPDLVPLDVVTSADHYMNKRSGRLFHKVFGPDGPPVGKSLHIGDNEYSDVMIPGLLGLRAVHHHNVAEEAKKKSITSGFGRRRQIQRGELCEPSGAFPSESKLQLSLHADGREVGRYLAPLFVGLAQWIAESARHQGVRKVHFFTREGLFFSQVFTEVCRSWPRLGEGLEAVVLPVSRLATFLPSLRGVSTAEFMRVWTLYSTQSVRALLVTLGLDPGRFEVVVGRHGIAMGEAIQYPWMDARVVSLCNDPAFREPIERERDAKRELLRRFLAQMGVDLQGPNLLVDIGWRGSIQDNLAIAFPSASFAGHYVGLQRFLNPQPPNGTKAAFLYDLNIDPVSNGDLERFLRPIEMICNGPGGSVVGYEDRDGLVGDNRLLEEDEDHVYRSFTCDLQGGVIDAVREWVAWCEANAAAPQEMADIGGRRLRNVLLSPPRSLAKAFLSLSHNESFGLASFVKSQSTFPYLHSFRALLRRSERQLLKARLWESGWPHALMSGTAFGIPLLMLKKLKKLERL